MVMTKVDMFFLEREERAVAKAVEETKEKNKQVLEKVKAEATEAKAEAAEAKAEARKAAERVRKEKERSILVFVRDKQEDGVAKETVVEKLMRHFNLSREKAERYYEKSVN